MKAQSKRYHWLIEDYHEFHFDLGPYSSKSTKDSYSKPEADVQESQLSNQNESIAHLQEGENHRLLVA